MDGSYAGETLCNYDVTYVVTYSTDGGSSYSSTMPLPFTSYDSSNLEFTIYSEDTADVGSGEILIKVVGSVGYPD